MEHYLWLKNSIHRFFNVCFKNMCLSKLFIPMSSKPDSGERAFLGQNKVGIKHYVPLMLKHLKQIRRSVTHTICNLKKLQGNLDKSYLTHEFKKVLDLLLTTNWKVLTASWTVLYLHNFYFLPLTQDFKYKWGFKWLVNFRMNLRVTKKSLI